jgi:hypothetical protein
MCISLSHFSFALFFTFSVFQLLPITSAFLFSYEIKRRTTQADKAIRIGDYSVLCIVAEGSRGSPGLGQAIAAFRDFGSGTRP